ncbi:MAG TPA: hypothetical protein VNE58_10545 [Casimicrobiaceae bacterium]|nr:hypothetical protein [Casimicrobiaceae bacterium]
MEATVHAIYPNAVRTQVVFDVPPPSLYPKEAAKRQPHLLVHVLVVVDEDGRVELAQGTMDDAIYAPAIRGMLAKAKAQPLVIDGKPRSSWSLVSFLFEYAGER